jgi:hypothetical protein
MISNHPAQTLRPQVNWQIWLAFSLLATFGLFVAGGTVLSLAKQISIDQKFKAQGKTVTGVITDLQRQAGSRGLGNWHPKVEFIVSNSDKREMIDRDADIAGNVIQGESLKQQFVGRTVQVEYLPDFSVVRVLSHDSSKRNQTMGHHLLLIALALLLLAPLALAWWKPQWVIPKKEARC